MSARKKALGRGLGDLLGARPVKVDPKKATEEELQVPAAAGRDKDSHPAGRVDYIPVHSIRTNPYQPRQRFNEDSLRELADSIASHGVLQPILVSQNRAADGGYTLVAGERRFRAAEKASLRVIPAIIQDVTEEEMLEIAIVENVQRDDLNAVEEARAYRSLIDSFGWSQEQVAQRVGKNRSTVANALRLLKLGEDVLRELEEGRMTPGHARAILAIDDAFYRQKLRTEIIEKGLSVREAERRSLAYQKEGAPTHRRGKKSLPQPAENLDTVSLEERLMVHLGCRVRIKSRDGQSGAVEIPFRNPDELERFFQAIGLPD